MTKDFDERGKTSNLIHHSSEPLDNFGPWKVTLIMMYWSFTTLSTVGLGDFYPMSNYERLMSSFGFLCGVAVFSYIMGNFADVITFILDLNQELEEG